MRVIRIPLRFSNAYLVIDQSAILVDAGFTGDADSIIQAITDAGISPYEIQLLVHTHGHIDHAGATAELQRRLALRTLVHTADATMLATGTNGMVKPRNLEARAVAALMVKPYEAVTPDILIHSETSLIPYGINGTILCTPGHTKGSISLVLGNGDAIVGDVMMGGWLGGAIRPTTPNYHYFVDDWSAVNQSISHLLSVAPQRWYVGHGGPLTRDRIARQFARSSDFRQ